MRIAASRAQYVPKVGSGDTGCAAFLQVAEVPDGGRTTAS